MRGELGTGSGENTRRASVALILGIALIALPLWARKDAASELQGDIREVALLRQRLDSTRTALTLASSAADSSRIAADIKMREYYVGQRAYHLQGVSTGPQPWWRALGRATPFVVAGIVLCVFGVVQLVGARRASRASGP